MDEAFYVWMGALACLSLLNFLNAKRWKKSKARTFAVWTTGLAVALIAVAIVIAVFTE